MPVDRFVRLKLGSGLAGSDLGDEIIELSTLEPSRRLLAMLYGPMPVTPETSGAYRIPYALGVSLTYTLQFASLHLETAGSTTSQLVIEKSTTAGSFTASTIATLTLVAADQLDELDTGLGTISSGNLLRWRWVSIGTGAANFHAQLEGVES